MAIAPDSITLDVLQQEHPERAYWKPRWADFRLAYEGGERFLCAAGQGQYLRYSSTTSTGVAATSPLAFNSQKRRRFLKQFEGEPDAVYYAYWERAFYVNYLSAILDYFRHWLFSQPPVIRPKEGDELPDWFQDFFRDCTGGKVSLLDFVKDSFLDTLLCRRGGWMVRADEDEPNKAVLKRYTPEEIVDWECDSKGELVHVVLCKKELRREFPAERKEVTIWTVIDRDNWVELEEVKDSAGKSDLTVIGGDDHGLGKVPFVMLEVPPGLWVTDKLFSWQISLFNKTNRLENAELYGCFVQPYVKTSDPTASTRVWGEQTVFQIRPQDPAGGGEEDFGWKSPDISPMQHIAERIKELRDEGYRIVHQMALAVDSKSIGAIARSGASKIEDRKASEIILAAYGGYVRDAIIRTLTLLSEVYGDATIWTCDGFDNFQVSSLDEELQIAAIAQSMNFKSQLAKEKLELKIINRLLDHEDESTKEEIEKQTHEGYEQEAEQAAFGPVLPFGAAPVDESGQPIPPDEQPEGAEAEDDGAANPFAKKPKPKKVTDGEK